MRNIYLQILEQKNEISSLALATVTSTSGSSPQKPGSSALFNMSRLVAGTVGGGVFEGRVEKIARQAISAKKSVQYTYNLANDISAKNEAICGGTISALIDANLQNSVDVFEQLGASLGKGIPGVLITMVNPYSEQMVLVNRYWMSNEYTPDIPEELLSSIKPEVMAMLRAGDPSGYKQMYLSMPGEEPVSRFCLEAVFPLPRLVIAGAGHIGKSLAHLGNLLDFQVTVIDDRGDFANTVNIPDADHIVVGNIGESIRDIPKGRDTYVVIVTRGHADDAEALKQCIGSDAAFVGMIGSKHKVAAMKESFLANGWATPEQWNMVFSPVGLDIKSKTVEEIAVSIAAQLVLVRNSAKQD